MKSEWTAMFEKLVLYFELSLTQPLWINMLILAESYVIRVYVSSYFIVTNLLHWVFIILETFLRCFKLKLYNKWGFQNIMKSQDQ